MIKDPHLYNLLQKRASRLAKLRTWGVLALASTLVAPAAMRVALLMDKGLRPGLADLRGLASDLAISALVAFFALLLHRGLRAAGWALLAIWLVVNHANFEHVTYLGSFVDWTYAAYLGDASFLFGSALSAARPWMLAAIVAAALMLFGVGAGRGVRIWPLVLVAALAGCLAWRLPTDSEGAAWRRAHVIELNLGRLLEKRPEAAAAAPLPPPDLKGEPAVARRAKKTNVVLLMVESISGAYLPSVAAAHGVSSGTKMPILDGLGEKGLLYTSFVTQQRQTNRGEYALLCGDHPRLRSAEAKMSAFVRGGTRQCLPALLRDAGYETVYMQAASLAFMLKDQFMPRIGFSQTIGAKSLPRAYVRTEWGVDDRAFLEQASEKIEELRKGPKPFFLTLLTVGTHHPFQVPADFAGPPGASDQGKAIAYLDSALGELFERLERSGALEDTLVLVTSDESAGLLQGADDWSSALSQSWGFLLARAPTGEHRRVGEAFVQSDVALSVLDYLGMPDRGPHLTGRSLFRRYSSPRTIYFANTYLKRSYALETGGRLLSCPEGLSGCTAHRIDPQHLFGPPLTTEPSRDDETRRLGAMVAQSLAGLDGAAARIELITDHAFAVSDEARYQYVFAGQYLDAAPDTAIDMDLEVKVSGGDGSVDLTHELRSEQGLAFGRWLHDLRAGDSVVLRYRFTTPKQLDKLESRLLSSRASGSGMRLEITRATLTLSRRWARGRDSLEVEREEIHKAGAQAGAR